MALNRTHWHIFVINYLVVYRYGCILCATTIQTASNRKRKGLELILKLIPNEFFDALI